MHLLRSPFLRAVNFPVGPHFSTFLMWIFSSGVRPIPTGTDLDAQDEDMLIRTLHSALHNTSAASASTTLNESADVLTDLYEPFPFWFCFVCF